MAREDEDRPAPRPKHALGEPLETISIDELRLRIASLRDEAARLEAEIERKQLSRDVADAVFRR